ncbi:uncharacterized protein LOC120434779 [Oreochromis aureus]|uniref:uncharacterized protein LOC120434779 n=1 Tax=Oreochromis aureus TaxID=47969 RepID=UPI001954DF3E|nr:uncharacterized protein LOC120434779 [Oreochromis aureus]
MLSDLTRSLNELREEVRAIRNTGSNESVDAGVLPLDFPLHNIEELNNAEAALQSQEANKAMVRRFALIGGTTLEVQVCRVMAYAITNELASVLNWAGKKTKDQTKQKRAFKDTASVKCLTDNVTQLNRENKKMKETVIDLQACGMRDNLVFSGIPEAAGEDVETMVKSFIKTHLKLPEDTVKNIAFDRVHRIGPMRAATGRPRPIVAKFGHFKQKEQVT